MPKKSPMSDKELFQSVASKAESHAEMLKLFGLRAAGGNFAQLKKWANIHQVLLPKFDLSKKTEKAVAAIRLPDEDIFKRNSSYANRTHMKMRLRRIWSDWFCALCGIGEEWNGKCLTLQLDHINGVHDDHRVENLRLLCPNCHSQTDTFCGRNK